MPTELISITKPMLATGIQWTLDISNPSESIYMYVAIDDNPIVQPAIETISSNFRPSFSTKDVELNVPITCIAPNMIDDKCASMCVPDSWNITTLYRISVKQPQYWFKNVRTIPTSSALYTIGRPTIKICFENLEIKEVAEHWITQFAEINRILLRLLLGIRQYTVKFLIQCAAIFSGVFSVSSVVFYWFFRFLLVNVHNLHFFT